jgi:hypothetical protein
MRVVVTGGRPDDGGSKLDRVGVVSQAAVNAVSATAAIMTTKAIFRIGRPSVACLDGLIMLDSHFRVVGIADGLGLG